MIESISEKAIEDPEAQATRKESQRKKKEKIGQEDEHLSRPRAFSNVSSGQTSRNRVVNKVAQMTSIIWDEFFLCDPRSDKIPNKDCPCGECFEKYADMLDELLLEKDRILSSAKFKAIPPHIIFFCQSLQRAAQDKFKDRTKTLIAEFLFDKWLLKALSEDGH